MLGARLTSRPALFPGSRLGQVDANKILPPEAIYASEDSSWAEDDLTPQCTDEASDEHSVKSEIHLERETVHFAEGTKAGSDMDEPRSCRGSLSVRTFGQLLLELAEEHTREVASLRQQLEAAREESPPVVAQAVPEAVPQHESGEQSSVPDGAFYGESRSGTAGTFVFKDTTCGKESAFSAWSFRDDPVMAETRLSPFDFTSTAVAGQTTARPSEMRGHLLGLLGWDHTDYEASALKPMGKLERIVRSQAFDSFSGAAIILNSVLHGWAANHAVTGAMEGNHPDEVPQTFQSLTVAFMVWFSLELLLRLYASGRKCFSLRNEEWSWNLFDGVVVCSDLVHSVLEIFSSGMGATPKENITVVRILRVFRITRALRVVRLFRFFRELRMMVYSVLKSASSLLWSLVLLSFTIYAFAVYFIQITAYHYYATIEDTGLSDVEVNDKDELRTRFGNLASAEYSLYMAVSGGISWGELNRLFIDIHHIHGVVFCIFIFFTTFALLNIITGIFVETAMSTARNNQEELVQEQMHATAGLLEEMKRIFNGCDVNRDGSISLQEFEDYLENREVRHYLDALGIGLEKAKGLFELLDLDMSGEITLEEFTFGCLRLKGWAKSIDLATLMNHNRRMAEQWKRFFSWSARQFERLHRFQERVERRLAIFDKY